MLHRGVLLSLLLVAACAPASSSSSSASASSDESATSQALTAGRIRIVYDRGGPTIEHGYDIKQPRPDKATQLVTDPARTTQIFGMGNDDKYHFNLIRIPILAVEGHPGPGDVMDSVYARYVQAVKEAQSRKPALRVFASLRSENETKIFFPEWTKKDGTVVALHYGRLLMDYVKYFQDHGITVDFIGPDNEPGHSVDGQIDARKFRNIVDDLRRRYEANGLPMVKIVGNCETSARNNRDFLDSLFGLGTDAWADLDVASFHYNPLASEDARAVELPYLDGWRAATRSLPRWSTEFHWDALDGTFRDMLHGGIGFLDQFAMGMSQIVWWSFSPEGEGTTKAFLESAFVKATVNGRVLATDDHDGASLDYGKFNSMAFRQDDDVTLIVVNDTETSHTGKWVEVPGQQFETVTATQWTTTESRAGTSVEATTVQPGIFKTDFPANSITVARVHGVSVMPAPPPR